MLPTYKAILRGNRIEWRGDESAHMVPDRAVAVYITILDEPAATGDIQSQGQRMAEILARLADINALGHIAEPATWEREVRQDRVLPDRDA